MPTIDLDRVVMPITGPDREDIKCVICHGLLRRPVVTPCCRQLCCSQCIYRWLAYQPICPFDRQSLTAADQLLPVPRVLDQMLANIQVRCESHGRGCPAIVHVADIAHHLIYECQYTDHCLQCGYDRTLLAAATSGGQQSPVDGHNCVDVLRQRCMVLTHDFGQLVDDNRDLREANLRHREANHRLQESNHRLQEDNQRLMETVISLRLFLAQQQHRESQQQTYVVDIDDNDSQNLVSINSDTSDHSLTTSSTSVSTDRDSIVTVIVHQTPPLLSHYHRQHNHHHHHHHRRPSSLALIPFAIEYNTGAAAAAAATSADREYATNDLPFPDYADNDDPIQPPLAAPVADDRHIRAAAVVRSVSDYVGRSHGNRVSHHTDSQIIDDRVGLLSDVVDDDDNNNDVADIHVGGDATAGGSLANNSLIVDIIDSGNGSLPTPTPPLIMTTTYEIPELNRSQIITNSSTTISSSSSSSSSSRENLEFIFDGSVRHHYRCEGIISSDSDDDILDIDLKRRYNKRKRRLWIWKIRWPPIRFGLRRSQSYDFGGCSQA